MYDEKIRALRMERQHLLAPANETEYDMLYRDLQPGQNVYWNGFGQPRPRFRSARISTTSPITKAASFAVNSSKGALRAATSAGSCPKTSSFSQRCTASRSKTRR